MDEWKGTTIVFLSSPSTFEDNWIWDNFTSHSIIQNFDRPGYFYFLLGMAFLGGFLCGFFLQCIYCFFIKKCLTEDGDISDGPDGLNNPAFVEDESQPPVNDHPPDYDTVMSGVPANETNGQLERIRNILRRFLSKKEENKDVNTQMEERPPSYSWAMANLQQNMNST